MIAPNLELADIVREHGRAFDREFGGQLSMQQRRVLRAIAACRTAELGGRKYRCADCASECYVYNSCRNRHCPKCQAKARADWTEAREAELLPIPYFHAVFTLPQEVAALALQNKRVVYDALFSSSSQTLQVLAADPKHLGAHIGILAVLHTWGQTLSHHPHVHCVVTGGGISLDGRRWVPCKRSKRSEKDFFVHVDVMKLFFRKRFIRTLKEARRKGKLRFHGKLAHLRDRDEFDRWIDALPQKWCVYVKRPFRRTKRLVRYLARYTHRVAISNQRLISMEDGAVKFSYKNYSKNGKHETMRLTAIQFIGRFLMHVLPLRFMRIRHYGFLANRCRKEKLALCRRLLGVTAPPTEIVECPSQELPTTDDQIGRCPLCNGELILIDEIPSPWATLGRNRRTSRNRAPPKQAA